MQTGTMRAEPSPYEAVLITATLESPAGVDLLLEQIQQWSQERIQLRARLSLRPWSDREAGLRLQSLEHELDHLWAEVRRRRAALRNQLEAALGINPALAEEKRKRELRQEEVQGVKGKKTRRQVSSHLSRAC